MLNPEPLTGPAVLAGTKRNERVLYLSNSERPGEAAIAVPRCSRGSLPRT